MERTANLKTVLLISIVLPGILSVNAWADGTYSGGTGEPNDPYRIATAADMNEIGTHPNDWNDCFLLTADINLVDYNESNFNIIGPNSTTPFTGVFDGNDHAISNFTWNLATADYVGLFAYVDDPNAEIKDLKLIDPNVQGAGCAGTLVGDLQDGTITGCSVEGGTVSGGWPSAGGLAGRNSKGTILNCYAEGSVSGLRKVGGLVGSNNGTISNCYAAGSVTGDFYVGGLVGFNFENGTILNCCATGSITGTGYDVGGLVGWNFENGTISNCYATGPVLGNNNVGGLVGSTFSDSTISNCYATGIVSGGDRVGGLVGFNGGTISNCYVLGPVTGNDDVGALVGYGSSDVNSFWDIETTGIYGDNGKSSAEMRAAATFIDAGWDFVGESINGPNDIWRLCVDGTSYPKLAWQFHKADFVCPDGVSFTDFAVLASAWLSSPQDANWDPVCDISEPNDGIVDWLDLDVIAENWLVDLGISIKYGGGTGDINDPYIICEPNHLDLMHYSLDWDKHFLMTADIDMSGYTYSTAVIAPPFSGVFDGNGHKIENLNIDGSYYVGLFCSIGPPIIDGGDLHPVDTNSVVKNLVIEDCNIKGFDYFSGLAGENRGKISNCIITGSVTGIYSGSIEGGHGGGIAGRNYGNISNCDTNVDIRVVDAGMAEGREIVGYYVNCFYGGLVACNFGGNIDNCYAAGSVTGVQTVGGLVGCNHSNISNCYSTGPVSGNSVVGGLAGYNDGTILNCYAIGQVSGDSHVGGVVGYNYDADIFASFWDTETSGEANGVGESDGSGTVEVYGRTTAQMQMESTFTDYGWDFVGETINGPNDIWDICDGMNYPRLYWQEFTIGDFACPDGVDFIDFAVFSFAWLSDDTPAGNWNPNCDISELPDGIINELDLAVFTDHWLSGF